jgi:hypothetical protein
VEKEMSLYTNYSHQAPDHAVRTGQGFRASPPLIALPEDIVCDPNLSPGEKREVLASWLSDIRAVPDALPFNHPHADVLDAQIRALVSRRWELRELITYTPARTPEGLIAKAKVALWELGDGEPEEGPSSGSGMVAWSLARDIAGRAA